MNILFRSYNPTMTICLACEVLGMISDAKGVFDQAAGDISGDLQTLGAKIIDAIEEQDIYPMFMQSDFNDRTVLKLITELGLEPLMLGDSVAKLLEQLWVGKLSDECDGKISDFSKLNYLGDYVISKLPGQDISFKSLLG